MRSRWSILLSYNLCMKKSWSLGIFILLAALWFIQLIPLVGMILVIITLGVFGIFFSALPYALLASITWESLTRRISPIFLIIPVLAVSGYIWFSISHNDKNDQLIASVQAENSQLPDVVFDTKKHDLVFSDRFDWAEVVRVLFLYDVSVVFQEDSTPEQYMSYQLLPEQSCIELLPVTEEYYDITLYKTPPEWPDITERRAELNPGYLNRTSFYEPREYWSSRHRGEPGGDCILALADRPTKLPYFIDTDDQNVGGGSERLVNTATIDDELVGFHVWLETERLPFFPLVYYSCWEIMCRSKITNTTPVEVSGSSKRIIQEMLDLSFFGVAKSSGYQIVFDNERIALSTNLVKNFASTRKDYVLNTLFPEYLNNTDLTFWSPASDITKENITELKQLYNLDQEINSISQKSEETEARIATLKSLQQKLRASQSDEDKAQDMRSIFSFYRDATDSDFVDGSLSVDETELNSHMSESGKQISAMGEEIRSLERKLTALEQRTDLLIELRGYKN